MIIVSIHNTTRTLSTRNDIRRHSGYVSSLAMILSSTAERHFVIQSYRRTYPKAFSLSNSRRPGSNTEFSLILFVELLRGRVNDCELPNIRSDR